MVGQIHAEVLGVDILFAQANNHIVIQQGELPPVLADLRDVVARIDIADDLKVPDEVLREASAMRVLAMTVLVRLAWVRSAF